MAAVVLARTWLTDVGTGTQLAVVTAPDWSDSTAQPGEVRRYAGGRLRAVSRPGQARTLGFTVRALTAAQRDTLLGWAGRIVLVRDTTGRKLFGTFFGADVNTYRGRSLCDVKLTLQQVTYTEGV